MAQIAVVQNSAALASFAGVNVSVVTIQANGLMGMTGADLPQAIRALQTTLQTGGYGRLANTLRSMDLFLSLIDGERVKQGRRMLSVNREKLGFCETVLKSLVVRGQCVGFSRFFVNKPVKPTNYSPPDDLHDVTCCILAVSALWLEIVGSNGLENFISECMKHVVLVDDELLPELTRICSKLAEDLLKSGLGVISHVDSHEGEAVDELSKIIEADVNSKLKEDSHVMQATKSELQDLLWALHIDVEGTTGDKSWTNDQLVFCVYLTLKRVFTDCPLQLDYDSSKSRYQLNKRLPTYRKHYHVFQSEPWLVPCIFADFWDLMYLHNRPFLGNTILEVEYENKVEAMLKKLMDHTTVTSIFHEDKGLCSLVSFDSASVPIRDRTLHRATQQACKSVLPPDFAKFAQVAEEVGFFTSKELEEAEAVERGLRSGSITESGDYGPEENISRSLEFKQRTMAVLILQTIVMKLVRKDLHDNLQLFTPAMHASITDLKGILKVVGDAGSSIELWRILLVSAWFVAGKDIQYNINKSRPDIADCVNVMGPRATVLVAGVLTGSDDVMANNELWICNGPVPDLPTTTSGLILVDSTFEQTTNILLTRTLDKDVTPTPPNAEAELHAPILDLGPSYGTDVNKIRSWIRSRGSIIGFFNPLKAMSQMVTCAVGCRWPLSKPPFHDQSGVYKGWPVEMSELVAQYSNIRCSVGGGTATKLILLTHGNQTWRFCLAGVYATQQAVISGDCARCVEEKVSQIRVGRERPIIIL